MKATLQVIRFVSRHTWLATIAFVILLAISLTAARLLLPQLDHYKDDVEVEISRALGQPVSVAEFEIGWHGYGPRLFLNDVRLLDRSGEKTLLSFNKAYIDISVPLSLYRWQVALHNLTLSGIELELQRQVDGTITLAGVSLPQQPQAVDGGVDRGGLAWLFRQNTLAIENSTLHWRDLQQGDYALTMTDVNLFLRNSDDIHFLSGLVTLPAALGGQVRVMAEAQGVVADIENWPIDFYAEGTGLELVQWLVDQPSLGMRMVNGRAEVELWGGVQGNQLNDLKGRVLLRDAYLAPVQEAAVAERGVEIISSLFGEFVWQRQEGGWSLDVDRLRLVMDEAAWQPSRVHIEQYGRDGMQQLDVAASYALLDDVATLLSLSNLLSDEQLQTMHQLKPRGELQAAYLNLQFDDGELQDYYFSGQLKRLALLPWKKLPGFDGLDISLSLGREGGVAELGSRGGYLDLRNLFRDFQVIEAMQGRLAWQQQDDGLMLELRGLGVSNQDAELQLDGEVFMPVGEHSPVVKLLVDIKRGDGAATSSYLPAKIMPESAVEWLDRAIVAGDVGSGAMVLQGPIKQFPFQDGSGRFEVRFNVVNGILDYRLDWPRIEQVEAGVAFVGNRMEINAVSGKVLASDIRFVDVEIPNMRARPAQLRLHGRADGSTNDVIRFLNQSPLQQRFGAFTEGTVATGSSYLDLSLNIPLQSGAGVETRGLVSFKESGIDFTRLGLDLGDINGAVGFSNEGLTAHSLTAAVMGQPAGIQIHTEELPQDKFNTVFVAEGETRLEALGKRLDLFVFPHLAGESHWQARLEVPRSKSEGVLPPVLKVSSDLVGTAVSLPEPLTKSAGSKRDFELIARFEEQNSQWFFDYGNESLTGIFELQRGEGVKRGELRFAGAAQLPSQPGLRIAGRVDRLAYDEWQPLFARDAGEEQKPALVNQIDMQLGSVELLGQTLHQVQLKGEHDQGRWDAQVQSDEVVGNVWLPDNWNRPLQMDLERLYLSRKSGEDEAGEGEEIDPSSLPPLTIKSKQARYGDLALGEFELVTRKVPAGLSIEKLTMNSDVVEGGIKGMWFKRQQHESTIKADLKVHDLGELLTGLGYVKTVGGGEGEGHLDLSWKGALLQYDLASMNGRVDLDFKDGSLLEVEPGGGRFFGLLSFSALPRRLLLDFRDFFGKGFAFDYMRGRFEIREGNAFTDNFALDGPAAMMEMQGRVGLEAEDYDQRVKVVPHVTSGLPTLAGILTGSIAPAVIVALIEKLAKPEVDKATGVYYQVSGSWDAPVIEPVELVKSEE